MSGDSITVVHPLFQEEGDGSIPISPLQLQVVPISCELAVRLNSTWHSRLPVITNPFGAHSLYLGAQFLNRWYASMIWTDPVARMFNHRGFLELRRFAISPDAPKNTASRVLSIATMMIRKRFKDIVKLVSYQDTDVHAGTIYKAAGWDAVGFRKGGENAWTSKVRERNATPASGDKIRWEFNLNKGSMVSAEYKE